MFNKKLSAKEFEQHLQAVKRYTAVLYTNETGYEKEQRIEKLKKDYNAFVSYYFPHYAKYPTADFHLKLANALKTNPTFKGILEAFRGSAKSTHADIFIPLWLKICGQSKCVLLVGQTEEKAKRLLASLQAELVGNQRFKNDFGIQFSFGNWADGEFITKDGCAYFAIGLGQSPRGTRSAENRPDLILVDDCDSKKLSKNPRLVKEAVEWITNDLMGCFDIGYERFLFLNNRISKSSILATLHKLMVEQKPDKNKWWYTQVNALNKKGESTWAAKYPTSYWIEKKASMTLRAWEAEYMNNPIEEGTVFREQWIRWAAPLPYNQYDRIVCYIDPSFKDTATSDYKAVKVWGKKGSQLHLLDAFVRQCSISTMVRYLYDMYEKFPSSVLVDYYIEANFMQDLILDDFALEGDLRGYQLPIRADRRKKPDKYGRIEQLSPLYERGFIFYNENKKTDHDFAVSIEQLLAVEPGSKTPDDSPDADEGAIYLLNQGGRISNYQPIIGYREQPYENY